MQMILIHRNASEFCPGYMQLVVALWIVTSFAFISKLISMFWIALIRVFFECPLDLLQHLTGSLINDLNTSLTHAH